MDFYRDRVHRPLDAILTSACGDVRCDPNSITLASLLLLVPVLLTGPWCSATLCALHDLLDRLDGSMARLMPERDGRFGATLDACCDKIYAVLFLLLHPGSPSWAKGKIALHAIALLTRMLLHRTTLRTASTMHGKAGTWFENLSFVSLCLGWSVAFEVFFALSCVLSMWSWLRKASSLGQHVLAAANTPRSGRCSASDTSRSSRS